MSPAPNPRRVSVLVVDDYPDAADTLATVLRLAGFDARAAYGGAEALALAGGRRPDIVLLDLMMPDPDGFALAERLRRELRPGALLVAVTGCTQPADRQRAWLSGVHLWLTKPVDPHRVLSLVRGYAAALRAEETARGDVPAPTVVYQAVLPDDP